MLDWNVVNASVANHKPTVQEKQDEIDTSKTPNCHATPTLSNHAHY